MASVNQAVDSEPNCEVPDSDTAFLSATRKPIEASHYYITVLLGPQIGRASCRERV